MPYIAEQDRVKFNGDDPFEAGRPKIRDDADRANGWGEINFLITSLLDEYIHRVGLSYATLNGAIGALECCKLELYRRLVATYEEVKIKENGDVYRTVSKRE